MADVIKVLGQQNPAAATEADLYEVPNLTQTTVSSIVVCNRTAAGIDFRVSVAVAGVATQDEQFLYYDKEVPANDSFTAVLGLTLNEGDVVRVYSTTVGLSFNMFGVETS